MNSKIVDFPNVPHIPPDIQEYIEKNGYEVECAQGAYWYVCGMEDGEPFELGLDLFIKLTRTEAQSALPSNSK